MSESKKESKPLDMTSDEAVKFLFPQEAIDEMKRVANPVKAKGCDSEQESDDSSYEQDSK